MLISGGSTGVGPAEGRIHIEAVKFQQDSVIIHGEWRPVTLFNPATGETSTLGLHEKVEIEAELPSDKSAASELLHRIFLTSAELNLLTCSADQARIFREWMVRAKQFTSVPKDDKHTKEGPPRQLCFPDGTHAYVVANEVTGPKPLQNPAPAYPVGEPPYKNRTTLFAVIVDATGRPADIVIVGASATAFDLAALHAIQNWRFQPATYQGKPVPVAVTINASFPAKQLNVLPPLGPIY